MQFPSSSTLSLSLTSLHCVIFLSVRCRNPLSSSSLSQSSKLSASLMDRAPKTESGSSSPPAFASANPRNLKDMTISELVTVLRSAFLTEDFDVVEAVLESRYAKLRADEGSWREKFEFEKLERMHGEDELRKKEEECERLKRTKESYEVLLKNAKEASGLVEKDGVGVFRKKNDELECELKEIKENYEKLMKDVKARGLAEKDGVEVFKKKNDELESELKEMKKKNVEILCQNFEMKEMEKKWVDDRNSIAEMRKKNAELEGENCELKKKWIDDNKALDEIRIRLEEQKVNVNRDLVALRRKNGELEEERKKDLATLGELKAENRKLADEKRRAEELAESLERKFGELNGRVARLEDDARSLVSADTGGGNVEGDSPAGLRASFGVIYEQDIDDYEFGNSTGGTMKRNKDINHSLGGVTTQPSSKGSKDAVGGKVKLEVEIINLDDSDDDGDGCTSKRLHGKKALSGITIKNEPQSLPGEVHQKNTPALESLKRKMLFSDSSSSPSSSEDEFVVDRLPISSVLNKRSKT